MELELQAQFDSLESVLSARALNISRTGVFVKGAPRPPGTPFRCTLRVEEPAMELLFEGIVVRSVPPSPDHHGGVGVQFTRTPAGWERIFSELVGAAAD